MTTDGSASERPGPTPAEEGRARAYLYGIAYGFGILFDDWTGRGDGTATTTDAEGATLIYTGDEMHPFDAVIPCTRHRRHRTGVTWPADLNKARDDTAACSAFARATVPPVIRRPAPLWLITRAGADRHKTTS
ncbi:hypothetical protein [Streptomyces nogalater]|uniref:Uncharacterized protein n=1 Tax=Streptomyces nogalater TaxID=38314 RepID=A0ABW0W8B9_STRNO